MGAPQRDWSAEFLKTAKGLEEQAKAAEKKMEAERVTGTSPSLAIEKYAGTYRNDLYGDVKVTHENGKLSVHFGPAFNSMLEHWNYDTFRAKFVAAGVTNAFVTFSLNAQGKADTVMLNLPGLTDYPFKRVAEPTKATTVSPIQ
jgi:hypothetical protein